MFTCFTVVHNAIKNNPAHISRNRRVTVYNTSKQRSAYTIWIFHLKRSRIWSVLSVSPAAILHLEKNLKNVRCVSLSNSKTMITYSGNRKKKAVKPQRNISRRYRWILPAVTFPKMIAPMLWYVSERYFTRCRNSTSSDSSTATAITATWEECIWHPVWIRLPVFILQTAERK